VWTEFIREFGEQSGTWFGGFPLSIQGMERPTRNSRLLLQMEESEASTAMWGDAGTAQVWMEVGEDYGAFQLTWACC
jgi:uncharacterized protein YwqG